jgi:hypothetical protein
VAIRRNLAENPALKVNTTGNATDWTSTPSGYARQTGVTGMDRTTGFGGSGARDPDHHAAVRRRGRAAVHGLDPGQDRGQ